MEFYEFPNFDYSEWNRPPHEVIRDSNISSEVYNQGYSILPAFLNKTEIVEILSFYKDNHNISTVNGGFFVSIYSKDLEYRNKVHQFLLDRLSTKFNALFKHFKYTCLNYAVKYPGEKGELFIHQDMAQVNEMEHSQVGVWIPLVDVSLGNGTLGILPYTHFSIPPHRSLYHDLPYSKLYNRIQNYMQPVELKAGDLLLFDIRLLHKSFVNRSIEPRVSLATSVVPKEAKFSMTYRDPDSQSNEFELLELEDDFYLTFKDFKSEKVTKPGTSTGEFVRIQESFVSEQEFLSFIEHYKLPETGMAQHFVSNPIYPIQEPHHQETILQDQTESFWKRLSKKLLN
jgi:hypothetical protein